MQRNGGIVRCNHHRHRCERDNRRHQRQDNPRTQAREQMPKMPQRAPMEHPIFVRIQSPLLLHTVLLDCICPVGYDPENPWKIRDLSWGRRMINWLGVEWAWKLRALTWMEDIRVRVWGVKESDRRKERDMRDLSENEVRVREREGGKL
nr:hypothetical protein Iba_chr12bCG1210 [Ipomoea batatas]